MEFTAALAVVGVIAMIGCGGDETDQEPQATEAAESPGTVEEKTKKEVEYAPGYFLAERKGEWAIAFHHSSGTADYVDSFGYAVDCSKAGTGKGVVKGTANTVDMNNGRLRYEASEFDGDPIVINAQFPKQEGGWAPGTEVKGRFSAGRNGKCGEERFVAKQLTGPTDKWEPKMEAAVAAIGAPAKAEKPEQAEKPKQEAGKDTRVGLVVEGKMEDGKVNEVTVETKQGEITAEVPPEILGISLLSQTVEVKLVTGGWEVVRVVP